MDCADGRRWSSAGIGDFNERLDPALEEFLENRTKLPYNDAQTEADIPPLPWQTGGENKRIGSMGHWPLHVDKTEAQTGAEATADPQASFRYVNTWSNSWPTARWASSMEQRWSMAPARSVFAKAIRPNGALRRISRGAGRPSRPKKNPGCGLR